MALTTSITPGQVATALGQSAPASGSTIEQQWQMWIDDALMLIQARVDAMTTAPVVDQARLDYVIREAVRMQAQRPDSATQVTTSVDDGAVTKTYQASAGRIKILDEWWDLLGLKSGAGKAFEVDTVPTGAGAGSYGTDYWWSSPTDQVWI